MTSVSLRTPELIAKNAKNTSLRHVNKIKVLKYFVEDMIILLHPPGSISYFWAHCPPPSDVTTLRVSGAVGYWFLYNINIMHHLGSSFIKEDERKALRK